MKVTFFSGTTLTSTVAAPQVIAVGLVDAEKAQLLSEINEQATALIDTAATTAADAIRAQVAADADRAETAAESAAQDALSTLGPALPVAFDARDDLVTAAPDLAAEVAAANGVMYRRQTGIALPSLNNWRPFDDTLDLRHVGSTSDLTNDFVGRFQQAVDDASARGWDLRVSQKADGTPYEYQAINHTLSGDLRAQFDRNALFMPRTNFQHFPTNGSTGPFEITAWPYDAATDGVLSGMLVDGATETKLVQGNHFTLSGRTVTLTNPPPAGSVLVLVSRLNALQFRSTPGDGRRLILSGDVNIDLSRIGYAIASASGSGLAVTNVDHVVLERLYVRSPSGYGGAPLEKRGDSAFTPLNFKSCHAELIHAEGMNDLAVYASGGASTDGTDDSGRLTVGVVSAYRCSTAMKYVRQGRQATIGAIHAVECGTGFLSGVTDGIPTGHGIHIGSINARRLGRRALDVRDTPQGGLHVGAITIEDLGYMPDGATPTSDPAGVFMSGASGVQVDYLSVRQRDWSVPPSVPAVLMAGSDNMGNRINGGWIEGLDSGVRETGAPTNDVGNSFTMTLKDVATPIDSTGALQTDFDLTVLTTTGGVVSQRRLHSLYGERITTEKPTFLIPGTSAPVYEYTLQSLSYRKALDYIQFSLQVQGKITHSETGRQFRIVLPAGITNATGAPIPLTVGRLTGINAPAGPVMAEIPAGTNYVLFTARPLNGGAPTQITSDAIASGVTVRVELAGVVPV